MTRTSSAMFLAKEPVGAGPILMLAVSIIVLLAGVCVLPYAFPREGFIKGASYETGFNNTVAYLWYVVFLWIPVFALARIIPRTVAQPSSSTESGLFHAPTATVWGVLLIHVALFGALYAYKGRFVFGESLYFQTLIYRMTSGESPYLDFSFYYGPAMIYPGLWFARVFPLEAAYAIWFVMTYLFGLYLLYVALRVVLGPGHSTNRWFVFLSIGLFNPLAALNVTFVRYLLPVVAVALALSYFRTGSVRALAGATCGLTAAMLYTFEAGTVALVGLALLILIIVNQDRLMRLIQRLMNDSTSRHRPEGGQESRRVWLQDAHALVLVRRWAVLLCGALLLCVVVFAAMDPSLRALRLYPEIALSYSAGAHNMPIYPNLPVLTVVAVTIAAAAVLFRMIQAGTLRGSEPLALGALGLALLMERGAFGVAEPAHFAYYGLPVFLLCLFLLRSTASGSRARILLAGLLAVGIAAPLQYYDARLFTPFLSKHMKTVEGRSSALESAPTRPVQDTLRALVEQVGKDKPYLMFQLDYYSFPVYRALELKYPTHFTMITSSARTHEDIGVIINQLRASKAVILARRADLLPHAPIAERAIYWSVLDWLSGAHTPGSRLYALMQRSEERLYRPLKEFILASYTVQLELDGIMALVPKDQEEKDVS